MQLLLEFVIYFFNFTFENSQHGSVVRELMLSTIVVG